MFKKWLTLELSVIVLALGATLFTSCKEKSVENKQALVALSETRTETPKKSLSKEFRAYWYEGKAEITSYTLKQARYGEIRKGTAVKIFVTEPFLKNKQVKADGSNPDNIPVLKLNATKNYLTGIYPYSIMTSSFYPVHDNNTHAIKVAFSSQEWCGQVYAQLNNREEFQISSHSYFETEADEDIVLEKTNLEDEIWNKIRIDPTALPTGDFNMIPSLEFIRLTHKDLKAYKANAKLTTENGLSTYEINYPELDRTLAISFTEAFPFSIESWSDSSKSGYGTNAQTLTSTGTKITRLKTPYWKQNANTDLYLRDSLGL